MRSKLRVKRVVVQFETISHQARLSVLPQSVETPTRLSGWQPAHEAGSLLTALAASLKRSPDTNLSPNCTITARAMERL
jgi:hypothetical protein